MTHVEYHRPRHSSARRITCLCLTYPHLLTSPSPPPPPLTAQITSVFCTCLLIGQIIALNALCRHLARDPLTTHTVLYCTVRAVACLRLALLCSYRRTSVSSNEAAIHTSSTYIQSSAVTEPQRGTGNTLT